MEEPLTFVLSQDDSVAHLRGLVPQPHALGSLVTATGLAAAAAESSGEVRLELRNASMALQPRVRSPSVQLAARSLSAAASLNMVDSAVALETLAAPFARYTRAKGRNLGAAELSASPAPMSRQELVLCARGTGAVRNGDFALSPAIPGAAKTWMQAPDATGLARSLNGSACSETPPYNCVPYWRSTAGDHGTSLARSLARSASVPCSPEVSSQCWSCGSTAT